MWMIRTCCPRHHISSPRPPQKLEEVNREADYSRNTRFHPERLGSGFGVSLPNVTTEGNASKGQGC